MKLLYQNNLTVFKNKTRNNPIPIAVTIIFYILLAILGFYYFSDNKITNAQNWYQNLYYILMFVYAPLTFISMETILKNREIKYLNHFAFSNKALVGYLSFKLIFKQILFLFAVSLLFLKVAFIDFVLFKAVLAQIFIYHIMFVSLSFFIYGHTTRVMLDPDYNQLKKAISGGWTDPQLAPLLFAPAVLFASVNVLNIIVAKTLESIFFEDYVSRVLLYIILASLIPLLLLGKRVLVPNFKKVYAQIEAFKYLYTDGFYQIEKGFFEERLLNMFPSLSFIAIKDLKVFKRKFRLYVLFSYIVPVIIFIIAYSDFLGNGFRLNLTLFFIGFIAIVPVIRFFIAPVEPRFLIKSLPIGKSRSLISKFVIVGFYAIPYLVSGVIFQIF
jgi:hypothetical protein